VTPFWERLLAASTIAWLAEIRASAVRCEARRPGTRKPHKTGTIPEVAALCLRALVERAQPKVCVEVGTFIGTSAIVLAAAGAHVYTCDKDNDVMEASARITCYPKRTSTHMLAGLDGAGVRAQFFFFDGRIQTADLPLLRSIAAPGAVYAFDDFEGQEKGVINVDRLRPALQGYRLEPPLGVLPGVVGRSTIAALVPEGWS
jgi:predicted O-methyltransferase YrrM